MIAKELETDLDKATAHQDGFPKQSRLQNHGRIRRDRKESDPLTMGKAFGRVLTEEDAKRYKKRRRRSKSAKRRESMEDKRIANDTKRLVKAWEVEDRKSKRTEVKAQKELKDGMPWNLKGDLAI